MAVNPGFAEMVREVLSDPTNLPAEFLSFLPQHVAQNPVPSSGSVVAPILASSGLTGATNPSRYVGATSSGAPTVGAFQVGDFVVDQSGKVWICSTAGSPGTWSAANAPVSSVFGRTGAITASSGDYTAAQVTHAADMTGSTLGFYGATPIAQQVGTGGLVTGFTQNTVTAANAVQVGSNFTGNNGTTKYTIGEIVSVLKGLGLIAP